MRGGLTVQTNYTLSKQVEEWGLNDPYTNTYQQGPYFLDHPQVLKITEIYELPFGEGKHFGANSQQVRQEADLRLAVDQLLQRRVLRLPGGSSRQRHPVEGPVHSGRRLQWHDRLEGQPGPRLEPLRAEAAERWQHRSDPGQHQARLRRRLQQQLGRLRVAPDRPELLAALHAVPLRPDPQAPRRSSGMLRCSRPRRSASAPACSSASKPSTSPNHNYFGRDTFNTTPDDSNGNFGTIFPSRVSTQNILPRQIQVRFKFNW